jgi:large subunit ribosomal protein L13
MTETIIDGHDLVLGRVASSITKKLLNEETVVILNAEKMVISGHLKDVTSKYKALFDLKDKANPEHSPYWSRRPDFFVKRVIRGMLPYKHARGKAAFKRLRVYIGIPEQYSSVKLDNTNYKKSSEIYENVITVKELLNRL